MAANQLAGRVAVVTGGGSGIGQATVQLFAAAGAKVVTADANEKGARETAEAIGGERALAVHTDVRDRASVDALMAKAAEWGGRLDILVNSAGIVRPSTPAESVTEEDWALVLGVNLTGTWRCCQSAFPYLRRQGGAIVNIASVAALTGHVNGGAYGPSKAAVIGLTQTLAVEWAAHRIRVNVIAPGLIQTPMTEAVSRDPQVREARRQLVPAGRLGVAADPARVVLFLASDDADYVTGETLAVDGGFTKTVLWKSPGGVGGMGTRS